jgi:heme exporter protein D
MSEWFAMGGYAAYVWSAYGISIAILAANVFVSGRKRNKIIKQIRSGKLSHQ